jgi:U3 small nucleolar RNA-associated protein 23
MRITKLKTTKKHLNFYKYKFDFQEPYQILIDGNFCYAALENKIHIREQLPKILGGAHCKQLVTSCVLHELKSLGETFRGAFLIAKRLQVRACGHQRHPKAVHECFISLIENDNPHHYLVATQDSKLKQQLRHIPGVPILYIHYNVVHMEGPSALSQQVAKQTEQVKLLPKMYEPQGNHRRHDTMTMNEMASSSSSSLKQSFKGKRRAKAPNPLSVRKKKIKSAAEKT